MTNDKFGFGECKGCGKVTVLKNSYCSKCNDSSGDLLKDLFKPYGYEDLFNKEAKK